MYGLRIFCLKSRMYISSHVSACLAIIKCSKRCLLYKGNCCSVVVLVAVLRLMLVPSECACWLVKFPLCRSVHTQYTRAVHKTLPFTEPIIICDSCSPRCRIFCLVCDIPPVMTETTITKIATHARSWATQETGVESGCAVDAVDRPRSLA